MPMNIEIKARVSDVNDFLKNIKDLGASFIVEMCQKDTFFNCPNGRLKLRVKNSEQYEMTTKLIVVKFICVGSKEMCSTILAAADKILEGRTLREVENANKKILSQVMHQCYLYMIETIFVLQVQINFL
uniref:CYTH domain-containing protein n=1 Tax=Romanomermis culicivorax TaxID=13658 RepID=A0A915HQN1_ROMCU